MARSLSSMFLLASIGCGVSPKTPSATREHRLGDDLVVLELEPGLTLHVFTFTDPDGPTYTSNGLLVREHEGWVMLDTAWGDEPAARLIEFAKTDLGAPIVRAFATH